MKISEQVAELEGRLEATANQAECYLIGIRAGLRDDVMVGTAPEGEMDRGWREGKRLRKIARMDLEGFRAGVLGETYGDGADPAFVAGYHDGEKARMAIVQKVSAPSVPDAPAAEAESRVKVGGNPPEPEIGMVYRWIGVTRMVTGYPFEWPSNLAEIRAPWGGPVVWRRE